MTQGRLDRSRALPRAHTVCVRRIRMTLVREAQVDTSDYTAKIPRTWGDCQERALGTATNPCAYLRCRHNLLLDISEDTGSYKVTWPHLASGHYGDEYDALPRHTCALRVADEGGMTLDEIGVMMNLTRERVRQIETKALLRLRDLSELVRVVDDELDTYSPGSGAHGDLDHHAWVGR
jgi:hypothetical protein